MNSSGLIRNRRSLVPVLEGSRLELSGGWNRPPMEMSDTSMAVFERAKTIGSISISISKWVRWGGSSDANLTAAEGHPHRRRTRSGGRRLPPAHRVHRVAALPARMALFAELVASLANRTPCPWQARLSMTSACLT